MKYFIYFLFLLVSIDLMGQADGSPDSNFGVNGKITLPISGEGLKLLDASVLGDGSFVVTGSIKEDNSSDDDLILIKVNSNGNFEPSFGNAGVVVLKSVGTEELGRSIAIQKDGKILVVGHALSSGFDILIVRYNINGSLDSSFGDQGKLIVNLGSTEFGMKVKILDDDKILVAGRAFRGTSDLFLLKLNPDGSRDNDFGNDGLVFQDVSGADDYPYDMMILPQGQIVVGGEASQSGNTSFMIASFLADGSPDTSFGDNGKTIVKVGNEYNGVFQMKRLPNGKYVLVGNAAINNESELGVAVFNQNGTIDTSFGLNGTIITSSRQGQEYMTAVVPQEDNKFIGGGIVPGMGSIFDFVITRYLEDGTIDLDFGTNGFVYADFDSGTDVLCHLAITNERKILAIGSSARNGNCQLLVMKLNNSQLSQTTMEEEGQWTFFPNPSNGQIQIKNYNSEDNFILYDAYGRFITTITKEEVPLHSADGFTWNLGLGIPNGIYWLKSINHKDKSTKIRKLSIIR